MPPDQSNFEGVTKNRKEISSRPDPWVDPNLKKYAVSSVISVKDWLTPEVWFDSAMELRSQRTSYLITLQIICILNAEQSLANTAAVFAEKMAAMSSNGQRL